MSTNSRLVRASADQVWDVLSDGWLHPAFVVGASRMRKVDEDWPAIGAELHHSVGVWPLLVDDTTDVVEAQPPTVLKLRALVRPGGQADVTFRLRPRGPGTEVTIEKDPSRARAGWCRSPSGTSPWPGATRRPCRVWPSSPNTAAADGR